MTTGAGGGASTHWANALERQDEGVLPCNFRSAGASVYNFPMSSLIGKSAIVTGSTSGIGLGILRALAAEGCAVVMNGRRASKETESVRATIESESGQPVRFYPADMTRPAEIADLAAFAEKEFGKVDILVNNAGIQFVARVEEFPAEKWDAILAINLSSAFHMIQAALPGMRGRKSGRIINIASAHGLSASPFKSAYVAAKHGIVGLAKTVALEVAEEHITCNAICPGYVLTPLVESQIADTARTRGIPPETVWRDVILARQPTKRFVSVEEIAAMVVYLCGDSAAGVTGAALSIDGGWSAL